MLLAGSTAFSTLRAQTSGNGAVPAPSGVLTPVPSGAARQLSPMTLGVNTQCRQGPSWDDHRFLDQIATLRLQNIRYPGGTIGDFWDWRTGMLMQQDMHDPKTPVPINKAAKKINRYTLDDFKKALDRSPGATAVFMLNMLTDNLQDQIEMLKYARKIGIAVKYAEMGNEYYLSYHGGDYKTQTTGDYVRRFPTATDYANESKRWMEALRKEFPGIKLAINAMNYDGVNSPWLSHPRSKSWNSELMAANAGADAAIIHIYTDNSKADDPAQSFYYTKKRIDENVTWINESLPGMPIWFTEFNIKSDRNRYPCSWMMALHTIFQTCEMMLIPQGDFVCYHNLTAETPIALIFNAKDAVPVKRGGDQTVEVQPLEMSASGYGYRMLGDAMVGARSLQALNFPDAPTMKVEDTTMPLVWGYAIQAAKSEKLILNLSNVPVTIACGAGVSSVRSASAPSLALVITSEKQITYSNPVADMNGNVTVPACSMNLITY